MPPFVAEPVHVRAPATSANLGPGFDAFGLALAYYDELVVRIVDRGVDIRVDGEGADEVPLDESHLVVRAMRAAFDRLGAQPPGLALRCTNRIPHGRGLGSSAAAIVAGVVAARELVEDGARHLDDDAALALAADIEGHSDNVAACLLGGFTITWAGADGAGPQALRLEPASTITPVVVVPPTPVTTVEARKLLPEHVPHRDAARNAARAALLVAAITGRTHLLLAATEDRLHQDYRAPAMPGSHLLVRRLRAAGIAAVISGAGPSVLALTDGGMESIIRSVADSAWPVYEIGIDNRGVCRVRTQEGSNP